MQECAEETAMQVDVAIIGGGPVGLGAAIALGRLGVHTSLFERHDRTSYHPRGHVVNGRTMEIFRTWGVADEIERRALPYDRNCGSAFCITLAGRMFGAVRSRGADARRDAEVASYGPHVKVSCPQDLVEPVLLRAARACPSTSIGFSNTVTGMHEVPGGMRLTVVNSEGRRSHANARYVIAADGAHSNVRDWLDIPMDGVEQIGNQIGVYFHADLSRYVADRPFLLWWIYNSVTTGVFIALDGARRWTYNFTYDSSEHSPDEFTPEVCASLLRAAIGTEDVTVDIKAIRSWHMQAQTAARFRCGPVFFAGDAAHPLPPTGGQGMNTGIGDVHNLAWKIALVLSGRSQPSILDSYEQERRPVAEFNVAQSLRNAQAMAEAGLGGMLAKDDEMIASLPSLTPAELEQLRESIERQRDHFDHSGQTYGAAYHSDIIVDDGAPAAPFSVQSYTPVSRPGSRAPHAWLSGEPPTSLIDLFASDRFTLVTAHAAAQRWQAALVDLGCDALVNILTVGPAGDVMGRDVDLVDRYGLAGSRAVLVRPDGYVAWRGTPDDAASLGPAGIPRAVGQRESAVASH